LFFMTGARQIDSSVEKNTRDWRSSFPGWSGKQGRITREIFQRALGRNLEACSAAAGIYFLFKDHILVYVGQATNVSRRLERHSAGLFDDALFIREPDLPERKKYERKFILLYRPQMNVLGWV
jgi:hypothetical protein